MSLQKRDKTRPAVYNSMLIFITIFLFLYFYHNSVLSEVLFCHELCCWKSTSVPGCKASIMHLHALLPVPAVKQDF